MTTSPFDALSEMPFPQQQEAIALALDRGQSLGRLLRTLGAFPDHEPLALALRALAERGELGDPEVEAALRDLFATLADTGVQRVLRGLDRAALPDAALQTIVGVVAGVLTGLPLERIGAACLMDRWLKNAAPARRDAVRVEALDACRAAIDAEARSPVEGSEDVGVDDAVLLQITGEGLVELQARAEARGRGGWWRARVGAYATRVLKILQARPRSVSLANAEEILARRVYTDPGHFLVELLQNAEDAGATTFEVSIEGGRVEVWHDGATFDAKDVVGVLSIGQTTKARGQIGFFGVGFKSVYEICERPQIYAALFNFEIADVSIPRPLTPQPERRRDGTLLVLPFREGLDEARSPERLHARALAVPAETLMTLRNLRRVVVARGGARRSILRVESHEAGRVSLEFEETGARRDFIVASRRFAREGPRRELSRVSETDVLVAVALDARGLPAPTAPEAPTIFSHLPTGERSGLRFMVHAHFDLPVDRERLDLESPWNLWAISRAGLLLAEVAERLCGEAASPAPALDPLAALLDVLPLPEELAHPAWRGLLSSFIEAAAALPLLRAADGALIPASGARAISSPALAMALAGVPLDPEGGLALAPGEARRRRVAAILGARPWGTRDLIGLLRRHLGGLPEGAPWPEDWLPGAIEVILTALGDDPGAGSGLDGLGGGLEGVPILPDQRGFPRRAADLALAVEPMRALYGAARPFVAPGLELDPTPGQAALLKRLGVRRHGPEGLLRDLSNPIMAAAILDHAGFEALHGALAALPLEQARACGSLAIFPDLDRRPCPLAPPGGAGAWLAPSGPLRDLVLSLRSRPPLLDPAFSDRFALWLGQLGVSTLGLEALLDLVDGGEVELDGEEIERLHGVLGAQIQEMGSRACARLASACIFPDFKGILRPLVGAGRALVPTEPAIAAVDPEAPWIAPWLGAARHLRRLPVTPVGPAQVVDALVSGGGLVDVGSAASLGRAYGVLRRFASELLSGELARLAGAPIWLDEGGAPRALSGLYRPATEPDVARIFEAIGDWPCAQREGDPSALEVIGALGLGGQLKGLDLATLVRALGGADVSALVEDEGMRVALSGVLDRAVEGLDPVELAPLKDAAIFEAEGGLFFPAGRWRSASLGRAHRAEGVARGVLSGGPWPLMSEGAQDRHGRLLDALQIDAASIVEVVEALEDDASLRGDEGRRRGRAALVGLRSEIAARGEVFAARVGRLAVWPCGDGSWRPAREVVPGGRLSALLGEEIGLEVGQGASGAVLAAEAEADARAMEGVLVFRSPAQLVVERVRASAMAGAALDRQPVELSTVARVLSIAAVILRHEGLEVVKGLPLSVDIEGRLVVGPRLSAEPGAVALAAGLEVGGQLADPEWARGAAALDPALAPALTPLRLLESLARAARTGGGALALSEGGRAAFFEWLGAQGEAIEADEAALGVLGNAPVIPTAAGGVKAPRELLLDPSHESVMASLGLDGWRCAGSVPASIKRWLCRVYSLDRGHLQKLVGVMAEAHKEAQSRQDGERSAQILGGMARAIEASEQPKVAVEQVIKGHKLSRLRVESDQGGFERIGRLMLPTLEQRALLGAFLPEPPPCVSDRYADPSVRALLAACGASAELDEARLKGLLGQGERVREGLEATLALARYVAGVAAERPEIVKGLGLAEAAWVPDGEGRRRSAGALYWPGPDMEALVGSDSARFPHPEFFHTVPTSISTSLPFRHAADAALEDVLGHIAARRAGEALPAWALEWFEARVRARSVDLEDMRAAFEARPLLLDDEGVARRPSALVCMPGRAWIGGFLATWSDGLRYSKLAATLKIPRQVGPEEIHRFSAAILARAAEVGASEILTHDPALAAQLPRCLELMVERGGRPAGPLALLVLDARGAAGVKGLGDPALVLPTPGWLEAAVLESPPSAPLAFPFFEPGVRAEGERWLSEAGVVSLGDLFVRDPLPERLPGDVTPAWAERVSVMTRALEAISRSGMGRGWLVGAPQVRALEGLRVRGRIVGEPLVADVAAIFEPGRGRLVVDAAAIMDSARAAEAIVEAVEGMGADPTGWRARLAEAFDGAEIGLDAPGLGAPVGDGPQASRGARGAGLAATGRDPDAKLSASPASPGELAAIGEVRPSGAKAPAGRGDAAPPDQGASAGWWSKVRRWWSTDESGAGAAQDRGAARHERSASGASGGSPSPDRDQEAAFRLSDHGAFFRPSEAIESQLGDSRGWVQDRLRPPEYGFSFSPESLPSPHRYAPLCISGRFDRRTQRWLSSPMDPRWRSPVGAGAFEVALRGALPSGENLFPMPLYGRLVSIEAGPGVRQVRDRDGRLLLIARSPADFSGTIALDEVPDFEGQGTEVEPIRSLLEPTAPDDELPAEVLDWIEGLAGEAPLSRAVEIKRFIQRRYRYDPTYLEDPALARWLKKVTRGRANAHLAALHAGGDGKHLGAGVCHELGALACEMMRRSGIPSAVASGWTWDRGLISDPDHLWAMALLPTEAGPRWAPIDPSTTLQGRPLHVGHRPPGPWRATPPRRNPPAPSAPGWDRRDPPRPSGGGLRPASSPGVRPPAPSRPATSAARPRGPARPPVAELMRVVRHLSALSGEGLESPETLQARCEAILADPAQAAELIKLIDG